jgi:hypothetical protein
VRASSSSGSGTPHQRKYSNEASRLELRKESVQHGAVDLSGADVPQASPARQPGKAIGNRPVIGGIEEACPILVELDAKCLEHRLKAGGRDRACDITAQIGPAFPGNLGLQRHDPI